MIDETDKKKHAGAPVNAQNVADDSPLQTGRTLGPMLLQMTKMSRLAR
jgi:hypothetical protein